MVAQSIVNEFCRSGDIARSIETVKAALRERAEALAAALERELPEARFVAPEGGYFLWVELPEGTDVDALFEAAAERGVAFVKGTDFLLEGGENTLRLAYSGVTAGADRRGRRAGWPRRSGRWQASRPRRRGPPMPVAVTFKPPSLNAARYDELVRRLEEAGAASPPGRHLHVCYGGGDQLRTYDVWESAEAFEAFGQTLIPILLDMGVRPGQHEVFEVHNVIGGEPLP